jgi:serine protease
LRARFATMTALIVAAFAVTSPAHATDPVGPPNPIQALIDAAGTNDVIEIPPGYYVGPIDFKGKDVTIRSTHGRTETIIDANGQTGVRIGPGGRIDGFTIRNASNNFGAGLVPIGTNSVITNNLFEANSQQAGGFGAGIGGNSASPIITNNIFRGHHCDSQHLSGVVSFVNGSSPTITNNLFVDNACRAINMTLPQGNVPRVVNNTFVGNPVGIRVDGRVPAMHHLYRNNVIVGNGIGLEVDFLGSNPGPTFDHNLLHDNGVDYDGIADQTGINGNLSADPQFVDPGNGDFHHRAASPATDSGDPTFAPVNDHDGTPRPLDGNFDGVEADDLGAYEAHPMADSTRSNQRGSSTREWATVRLRALWSPARS